MEKTATSPEPPTFLECNAPVGLNSDGWIADYVIVGEWEIRIDAGRNIDGLYGLLQSLPAHLRGRYLRPFRPGPENWGVVKVKFQSAVMAAQASFVSNQKLQTAPPANELMDTTGKCWAAVERHPTVALMRRNCMAATNALCARWPHLKLFDSMGDGLIYADTLAVLVGSQEGRATQEPGCTSARRGRSLGPSQGCTIDGVNSDIDEGPIVAEQSSRNARPRWKS